MGVRTYTLIIGVILVVFGVAIGLPLLLNGKPVPGFILLGLGEVGFFTNITILLVDRCCCCDKKTANWVGGILWVVSVCISSNLLAVGYQNDQNDDESSDESNTSFIVFGLIFAWIWYCSTIALIVLNCCSDNNTVSVIIPNTIQLPSAPEMPKTFDMFQEKSMNLSRGTYDIPVATPV